MYLWNMLFVLGFGLEDGESMIVEPGTTEDQGASDGTVGVSEPDVSGEPDQPASSQPAQSDWYDGVKNTMLERVPARFKERFSELSGEELFEMIEKGDDYTNKTTEVKREREGLDPYIRMDNWMNHPDNRQKAEKILALIREDTAAVAQDSDGVDDPYMSEINSLKNTIQTMQNSARDREAVNIQNDIQKEYDQVKGKYEFLSDFDMKNIMALSYQNGKKLPAIAKEYVKNIEGARDTVKKNYIKEKVSDTGSGMGSPGGNAPTPTGRKLSLSDGSAKKSFANSLKAYMKDAVRDT